MNMTKLHQITCVFPVMSAVELVSGGLGRAAPQIIYHIYHIYAWGRKNKRLNFLPRHMVHLPPSI